MTGVINRQFCHVDTKRLSDTQTDQRSIFPTATGGLPTVSFRDNYQVLLKHSFFWVLSEVWLIPGLWELVRGYVTLKNEGWITLGWKHIESTSGTGHVRILPHSSLCTPEARPPTPCFPSPGPTHNSVSTPARLTYSTASPSGLYCWPPAFHCPLPWTLSSELRPQPEQGSNLFTAGTLEYFSKWASRPFAPVFKQGEAQKRDYGGSSLASGKMHPLFSTAFPCCLEWYLPSAIMV